MLLDADGVLQLIGTPWSQALSEGGGPQFARALLAEEGPALSGRESLHDLLTRLVTRLGLEASADELMGLWRKAVPDPLAWQVVEELKDAGYTTVLATNQQPERRAWMREHLGYDGLCDVDAYSCCLGAAKPSPEYFLRVLELVGLGAEQADQALFVDDNEANTRAAKALGIRTVSHPADAGGALLRSELVAALSQ